MASSIERLRDLCGKAAIAFLLIFAALTPSISEAGHYKDALVHQAQGTDVSTADSVSDSDRDQEHRSDRTEKGTHCAFSHCSHVAVSFPDRSAEPVLRPIVLIGQPGEPAKLAGLTSPGPERPPRT